jgi:hypothetical protein
MSRVTLGHPTTTAEDTDMTRKADFNAEEWSTVAEGPLYAGLRVIAASRGGTVRESLAMGRVYKDARTKHGESELLDELVASPPTIDPQTVQQSGGDVTHAAMERLREADSTLEAKATPEELEAYRTFVTAVARAAAGAHKEGGARHSRAMTRNMSTSSPERESG